MEISVNCTRMLREFSEMHQYGRAVLEVPVGRPRPPESVPGPPALRRAAPVARGPREPSAREQAGTPRHPARRVPGLRQCFTEI